MRHLMENKVFVASRSFSANKELREILESHFNNVAYNETGKILEADELEHALIDKTHLIVAMEEIKDNLVKKCKSLKVISKYGVGLDNIDFGCLEKRQILLGWSGGVNKQSVAELALSSMISLFHLAPKIQSDVKKGIWKQVLGRQLYNKRVGIIGCGNVGKRLVELLKPFNCQIFAYDIKIDSEFATRNNIRYVDLDFLLKESDAISLHLPLTKDTYHFIDTQEICMMKDECFLLNYARGGLINENSLLSALIAGKIKGAALDVLEDEPNINSKLIDHENLIITSHIGGSAKEAVLEMGKAAIIGLLEPKPISYYLESM